jgi:acyl carrier protein
MSETRKRLVRCFQAVFPGLTENEALRADTSRVGSWDSVATVTLAAVVEEEFEVQFDPEEIETLTSFSAILEHIVSRNGTH